MGMGINHWEWEGMGLKKIFPLVSTTKVLLNAVLYSIVKYDTVVASDIKDIKIRYLLFIADCGAIAAYVW